MASISPTSVSCPKETHTSKGGYLRFTVTEITQTDGSTNQTTIKWKLTVEGTPYVNLHCRQLTVGGVSLVPKTVATVSSWKAGQTLNSGSTTFNNNADGSLSLSVFIKQLFYYTYSDTRWGNSTSQSVSSTMTCSTIPRYPILSYNTVSTTLNTMTCGLSNSRSGTITRYQVARVSDGTVLLDNNVNSTSFSFTLYSLSPKSNYSGVYKVRAYANGGWSDWLTLVSGNMVTASLPTVSTPLSADVDKSVTIQFTNLNYISSWKLEGFVGLTGEKIVTRTGITTNNYVFALTEAEKQALLKNYTGGAYSGMYFNTIVTSNGIDYFVKGANGASLEIHYNTPNTSAYLPTFEASYITEVKDTKYTSITGNPSKFIKNHNQLQGKIAPMVPKYGATGKSYTITIGSRIKTLSHTGSTQTFEISNVDSNSVKTIVVDSRGKTVTKSSTITLIDYNNPTFTEVQAVRENGTGTKAVIIANGKYTNWSGLAQPNSISKVEYRWKLATAGDSSYSGWSTISGVANSGGSWNIEATLPVTFDMKLRYYIQLRVTDKLETVTSNPFILSTANVFLWKDVKNQKLGINKKPERTLDVNGDFGVSGEIYSNNKLVKGSLDVIAGEPDVGKELVWFRKNKNKFHNTLVYKNSNTTFTNGVVKQIEADTNNDPYWKVQAYDKNYNYLETVKTFYVSLGRNYITFTKKDTYHAVVLGVNGSVRDTLIWIDLDGLDNWRTYTLSWDVTDKTQGSISWKDIQIEQNVIMTAYQAPIDEALYTRNYNGLFEKFLQPETIKNVHGTAIKFPDGTLICRGDIWMDSNVANKKIAFPRPFYNSDYSITITNIYSYSPFRLWTLGGNGTDGMTVYVYDVQNAGGTPGSPSAAKYLAIGRWKE